MGGASTLERLGTFHKYARMRVGHGVDRPKMSSEEPLTSGGLELEEQRCRTASAGEEVGAESGCSSGL